MPLTEKSLEEAGEMLGLKMDICIPKFLPYTTKSKLPKSPFLIRLYVHTMPLSGWVCGEQSFMVFTKK